MKSLSYVSTQGSLIIIPIIFKKDFIQQDVSFFSGIVTVLDVDGLQEHY